MKIAFYSLCLLVSLLLCYGCKSSKDDIRSKIEKMQTKPITIPYSEMLLWTRDSTDRTPNTHTEYKLVVYIDYTHCTECEMKKMYLWDDFVKLEQKYNGRFRVVFIVQASKKSPTKAIASALKHYDVDYTIYIDSTNIFSSVNPHIPSEEMYHVFLLDEKDSVILVGNPQFNSKIENRLLDILEQKF